MVEAKKSISKHDLGDWGDQSTESEIDYVKLKFSSLKRDLFKKTLPFQKVVNLFV